MTEGWPDFWIKGKYIELIDTINTVNLIKTIQQIDNITNLGTLDTLNTIGTIQKINPQNTDNVVIDRVKTINTIQTINTIDTLTTVNTIELINRISRIDRILNIGYIPFGYLRNGNFETGDFTSWIAGADATITTDAFVGSYAAKLPPGNGITQVVATPKAHTVMIVMGCKADVSGDILRVAVLPRTASWQTVDITPTTTWGYSAAYFTVDDEVRAIQLLGPSGNSGSVYVDEINMEIIPYCKVYQAEKDRTISREGTITHFSVSASAAGSTTVYTPSSGKKAKVLGWNFYVDSNVVCELRFSTSGNVIAGLPSAGKAQMNLTGIEAPTGGTDETIEIYVSGAANVKGWICVQEI